MFKRHILRQCILVLSGAAWCIASLLYGCNGGKKQAVNTTSQALPSGVQVLDNRLELSVFAQNSDILTPIGIAIDSLNQLFVLESHTHLPPKDYSGPTGDVVKMFVDKDGDGQPENKSVFADGLQEGMNLAFSPQGHLYVVTSRAVWILYDRDKNGVSEERVKVLSLAEPQKVYAHAALLGITFSADGWMYISRGNTGGAAWKMVGTDSSTVSGYGDGGNIVRARPDGTHLEEVATGFWNPMDLKFDAQGRLLAADNDPDSRGPNRLVHVVPGGDYGYKSLYGGSGIHPYLAWNGELPGTLPFAVGVGEAPSGLLDAGLANLPNDYQGQMLCTIWEEKRIVRVKLTPKGASVTGTTEVLIEGKEDFRPVALATDRQGNIYFTDWVLRDYPNHGKGRIWKLKAKAGVQVKGPGGLYTPPLPDAEGQVLQELYSAGSLQNFKRLKGALQSNDQFLRHAAVIALSQPVYREQVLQAVHDSNPDVRLGAILALKRSTDKQGEAVAQTALTDKDERIRQLALRWIGEQGMASLQTKIDKALIAGPASAALFETYLETVSHLTPQFIKAYRSKSEPYAKSIKRTLPPYFIKAFIADKSRPAELRALAIRHLENPQKEVALLISLLAKTHARALRLEALRTLATVPGNATAQHLLTIAKDSDDSGLIRAEALLALTRQAQDVSASVLPLLDDSQKDVQIEAARYLRARGTDETIKQALQTKYASLKNKSLEPLEEQLALALSLQPANDARPTSLQAWESQLVTGGDPARGRRVLYSVQSNCSLCHAVEGRGGDLGPDLTNAGKSKSRSQLISAILRPSQEVSPEYQGWYVKLKTGEIHQGRQIDIGGSGIELYMQGAGFTTFDKQEIADYGMNEKSLMPDGLQANLTVSDLRDLIAFLESSGEPVSEEKKVAQRTNTLISTDKN